MRWKVLTRKYVRRLSISVPTILTRAIAVTVINQSCHHVSGRSSCNHVTDFCHQAMYFLLRLSNFYALDASRNNNSTFIAITTGKMRTTPSLSALCFAARLAALQ
jgi:hypothetical protein